MHANQQQANHNIMIWYYDTIHWWNRINIVNYFILYLHDKKSYMYIYLHYISLCFQSCKNHPGCYLRVTFKRLTGDQQWQWFCQSPLVVLCWHIILNHSLSLFCLALFSSKGARANLLATCCCLKYISSTSRQEKTWF